MRAAILPRLLFILSVSLIWSGCSTDTDEPEVFVTPDFNANPASCDIDRNGAITFCDRSELTRGMRGVTRGQASALWNQACSQNVELSSLDWTIDKRTLAPLTAIGGSGKDIYATTWQKPNWPHTASVLKHDNSSWHQLDTGTPVSLFGIWSSKQYTFAVGANATILRAHSLANGDVRWEPVEVRGLDATQAQSSLFDIHGKLSGGNATPEVYAVGENGTVLFLDKDPNGTLYFRPDTQIEVPSKADLYGIFGAGGTEFIVVGENGTILSQDKAGSWKSSQVNLPDGVSLRGIFGAGGTEFIVVGDQGTILKGKPNTGWNNIDSGTDVGLRGIFGAGGTEFIVVGESGTILHGDGNTFVNVQSPTTETLTDVYGANKGRLFAVGENGSILHLTSMQCH